VTIFHEATCVRIIARTTETDYVVVKKNPGQTCASHIGYQGGKQSVNLAHRCCTNPGSTVHEFMHALGFGHEQTRPDRDEFVTVFFENISKGARFNYAKHETPGNMLSPYDPLSITHYGTKAFSINGKPTMLPKNGTGQLGQRTNLTKVLIHVWE